MVRARRRGADAGGRGLCVGGSGEAGTRREAMGADAGGRAAGEEGKKKEENGLLQNLPTLKGISTPRFELPRERTSQYS